MDNCPYCGAEPKGTSELFIDWKCGSWKRIDEANKPYRTEACRIRELKQQLEKLTSYTQHAPVCHVNTGWPVDKCSCGLHDILDALDKEASDV